MDSFRRLLNENNIRSDSKSNSNFNIARYSSFAASVTSSSELSPRSAISEISSQSEHSEGNKFRQLPCKVFLACGSCPYRDRCQVCISGIKHYHSLNHQPSTLQYLHDPRLICRATKTKTRKKNVEDNGVDR